MIYLHYIMIHCDRSKSEIDNILIYPSYTGTEIKI